MRKYIVEKQEDQDDEEMLAYLISIGEEYLDQYDREDFDEEDLVNWIESQDVFSDIADDLDDDTKQELIDAVKEYCKGQMETDEDKVEESLMEAVDFDNVAKKQDMIKKIEAGRKAVDNKKIRKVLKKKDRAKKWNSRMNTVMLTPLGAAIVKHKQNKMKRNMAGLKSMLDDEKDPARKKELQKIYDTMMDTCVTKNGRLRARPKMKDLSDDQKKEFKAAIKAMKNSKAIKNKGKKYLKDHNDFEDTIAVEKNKAAIGHKEEEKGNVEYTDLGDGVRLVARKKKRGFGKVYTKEKNGETVDYLDKDEFMALKAGKQQKESLVYHGLSSFIKENME